MDAHQGCTSNAVFGIYSVCVYFKILCCVFMFMVYRHLRMYLCSFLLFTAALVRIK